MKPLLALLSMILVIPTLSAQKIEVTESKEKVNGSIQTVLIFSTQDGDRNLFEKEWKKLMRSYKGKSERGDEIIFVNPAIPVLNSDTLVTYVTVHTKNTGIDFIAAFEVRDGFVSKATHPAEYETARKLLQDFAVETVKEAIREQIKEQVKELSKREKELKTLEKEKKDLEDDIVKYEKAIEQAKADIEKNLKDQETMQTSIKEQKELIGNTEKRLKEGK